MLSSLLEVAGLVVIVIATYIAAGLDFALYVLGGELLLMGYALEGVALPRLSRPMLPWRRERQHRKGS